jgi:hypothetical protein
MNARYLVLGIRRSVLVAAIEAGETVAARTSRKLVKSAPQR